MSTTRHPGGRPALGDKGPSTSTHVRLPGRDYDRVYQLAQRNRESVPDVMRRALAQLLSSAEHDDDD